MIVRLYKRKVEASDGDVFGKAEYLYFVDKDPRHKVCASFVETFLGITGKGDGDAVELFVEQTRASGDRLDECSEMELIHELARRHA